MDIGIDLGTTYSVIAVKGQVNTVEGYPDGTYLAECDVTIIPTPDGDPTFPSVFWVDPDDPTRMLIGAEAKQKAEEGQSPIMFSKRSIGTDEPLKLHDRTFTAREVATHTLRYLKACAEQALGQPVRRAVVTHPAYFRPNQVEETRAAAKDAGFDMSLPEQMMMEPAAAALAFIKEDERDPLRVLTYDLGGGTFDVTVLERSQGDIKMKAFDGDHLLGGYNFDRALVQWILEQIKAGGRTIPYDENNPQDRGRRAHLLQLAETFKINLSNARTDKYPVPIKVQDVVIDGEGQKVQFVGKLNREQYAELIKDELDKTIACCHSALAKADMKPEELHAILLVGGSTYGQWVQKAVADAFGQEVQQFNPDLCVGAGAALRAADLPVVASGGALELVLDVSPTSALPSMNVNGAVRASGGGELDAAARADLKVLLRTPQGVTRGPAALGDNGQFLFADLSLLEDEPSRFRLQVSDGSGLELLAQNFEVQYNAESAGSTSISTPMPKPLYLRTAGEAGDKLVLIAEEGVPLPARREITLTRINNDDVVNVPVVLEDEEIGAVTVDKIPPEAGPGSKVAITVEISEKNAMRGTATVITRNGVVAATRNVEIHFPPLKLPSQLELDAEFAELEDRRQQQMMLSQDAEQRTLLGGQGGRLSRNLKRLLAQQGPDKQEVFRALKELRRLVNPPADDMDPPRADFRNLLETCRALLSTAGAKPELQAYQGLLQKTEEKGEEAFTTKNHRKWMVENDNLRQLYGQIKKTLGGDGPATPPPPPPPTPLLKDFARHEVENLRAALLAKRNECQKRPDFERIKLRLDELEKRIGQIDAAIDKISDELEPEQGRAQVQLVLRPAKEVERDINRAHSDTTT